MARGDRLYIAALLVFALISFLPWSGSSALWGMAALGWLMAALMVVSPAIALVRILSERDRGSS